MTALAAVQKPAPHLDLVPHVRQAIARANLSQAAAAAEIGISEATLSQWLRQRYPGDSDAIAARCQRWLDAVADRATLQASLPDPPPWIETSLSARVVGALRYAQMARDIALVIGIPGSGKTVSAGHFATLRPNVALATMSSSARTIGPCLERIAIAMDISPVPSRSWRVEAAIIRHLTRRRTEGLLIVDEAQHLDIRSIEAIRALHDAAGIGIALLGSNLIHARLTGGARSAYAAQIWSRIGVRVRLGEPTHDDIDAVSDAWGLTNAPARQELAGIARGPGALRSVTKAMRMATLLAAGAPVDASHIRAAQREFDQ